MKEQLHTSYDTIGSSSYLTISLPERMNVVHYRLEMLTSNEITQLLPVSKRMMDGDSVLYFNISSLVSLEQILNRRKLKKEELLTIMEGLIRAAKDAADYQLPLDGFLMDSNYIFVDSATCKPFFVYLPIETENEPGNAVKQFFQNLILQGKLELSSDNFIQLLLNALNQEPFSLQVLEQCVRESRSGGQRAASSQPVRSVRTASQGYSPVQPVPPVQSVPPVQPVVVNQPAENVRQDAAVNKENQENPPEYEAPKSPGKPLPPRGKMPGKSGRKNEKKKDKKTKEDISTPVEEDGFDPEKAKKKFMLPQAVVMVALAAMVSFGFFKDGETGAIAINNILAVVILVALFEVILYREIYINSRNKKSTSSAKKKDKKTLSKTKSVERKPVVPRQRPEVPGQNVRPSSDYAEPVQERSKQPAVQSVEARSNPMPSMTPPPAPIPAVPGNSISDAATVYEKDNAEMAETQFAGDGISDMPIYLEYYENGIMTRVPLERESTLIGRLRSQVDFAVTNPKVGKIHAEFLVRGGSVFVKDLNSKNGTYINGNPQRIGSNMEYPLQDRDRITLADSDFTLRCGAR